MALLLAAPAWAGCLESGPAPGTDDGSGEAEARADGLVLRMRRDRAAITPGETVHVNASVTNEGSSAVGYREGCRHEWSVEVLDPDGDPVNWSRPMAMCQGFDPSELAPGESLPFPHRSGAQPFAWNGTLWDDEDDRWYDAPPGTYAVAITFTYSPDGSEDFENLEHLTGKVNVTVESGG